MVTGPGCILVAYYGILRIAFSSIALKLGTSLVPIHLYSIYTCFCCIPRPLALYCVVVTAPVLLVLAQSSQ